MSGRETPKGRCMNLLPPKRWEDREAWALAHPLRAATLWALLIGAPLILQGLLIGAPPRALVAVGVLVCAGATWWIVAVRRVVRSRATRRVDP